jgi:hypothetical protein
MAIAVHWREAKPARLPKLPALWVCDGVAQDPLGDRF